VNGKSMRAAWSLRMTLVKGRQFVNQWGVSNRENVHRGARINEIKFSSDQNWKLTSIQVKCF